MESPYRLSRVVRTVSSEVFIIFSGSERVGQVDLHFGTDVVHATIILERDLSPEDEEALLSTLDEDVISGFMPRFQRDDFVAHVFRGEEISRYTDAAADTDDEDGMDGEEPDDDLDSIFDDEDDEDDGGSSD